MLKTRVGHETWLVHQPDHARVAGYLAAHWGNDEFALPGHFAAAADPELLRQEVVHAIAEHDNGWWEWEANPEIDLADTMPLNLPDVAREHPEAGLQRWRAGVPRLSNDHPYIALLISLHAYWLYAFAFDDLPEHNDALRHPIFGRAETVNQLVAQRELTREFLVDQQKAQKLLLSQLGCDQTWSEAIQPQHLLPHVRLLQLLDAMSLLISFGGQQDQAMNDIPRHNWHDRVAMTWTPQADRRIRCHPFPFDTDPLEVLLPVRVIPATTPDDRPPLIRLHATPLRTVRFELHS